MIWLLPIIPAITGAAGVVAMAIVGCPAESVAFEAVATIGFTALLALVARSLAR